ncbi:MAG: hypothetical protein ACRC1P_11530, partial [Cellulosilyticaceae bacterium]
EMEEFKSGILRGLTIKKVVTNGTFGNALDIPLEVQKAINEEIIKIVDDKICEYRKQMEEI